MGETGRERLSKLAIRLSLGAGGSFLAAAFILQGFLERGFMIPAAISTFVLIAIASYVFARIKLHIFSVFTLSWLVVLAILRFWGI